MQIRLRNRNQLGQNVKDFIRKASNPQSLQTVNKYTINKHKRRSQLTLTPFIHDFHTVPSTQQHPDTSAKNKQFSNRLKLMLAKHTKSFSSRLFAEEERALTITPEEPRMYVDSFSLTHRKTHCGRMRNQPETSRQLKKKQMIKELFCASPKSTSTAIKIPSKTNSYFYPQRQDNSWQSFRVNDHLITLQTKKKCPLIKQTKLDKNKGKEESILYRTFYR